MKLSRLERISQNGFLLVFELSLIIPLKRKLLGRNLLYKSDIQS